MATAATSPDMERHVSAIIVVLEMYPQMMRAMIINSYPPVAIASMVQNITKNERHPFTKTLNDFDKKIISGLSTEGYSRCDVPLLYKLIRHFYLVETPTKKWGNKPDSASTNQGDDVERMKRIRNEIVHQPGVSLSEVETRTFFKDSEEIARRIDHCNGHPANGFTQRIQSMKIYSVTREKYIQILEKYIDLKERFKKKSESVNVDLFYGNDIAAKFEPENVEEPSGVTNCSIYLRDPNMDVSKVIEKLDEVKQKLNEGNFAIKFRGSEDKCLVVHIEIDNKCFTAKELLHKAIDIFLQKLFKLASLDKILRSPVEVVLVESDNTYEIDNTEDSYEDMYSTDHDLKLDVSVEDNIFQSEAHLYEHVNEFCNEIFQLTNQKIPTNGSSLGVIMTVQTNNALSTAEVTADMFLLLYDESSQTSEPYKCIEESLKFCCPDFVAPKKWSNMYRHATNLVKKGLGQVKIFGDHSSTSSSTKNSSVGYHCNKLGLLKDDLRNQSCRLAEKFHKKTIMNVGAFREICLFKKAEGKTWNDVKDWIFAITLNKVNVQKICYSFQKIHKKFTDLSKRGEKQQAEVFLSVDFSSFLSENVKRQTHGQNKENKSSRVTEKKLLIKNIELQKEVIEVNRENNLLSDIIKEESRKSEQLTKKLLTIKSKNEENIDLKQKLAQSNKTLKSIKRENFYKRVKRRETNIQRKQNKVYKNLQSAKEKISDLTAKQIKQEDKLRKLEHSKAEAVKDLKHKLHCKSNQICYFRSAKEKSTEELTRQKISLENEKQRNIVLNNQNINLQEQVQENEKNIETKTKGRYCDEMRSCILELSSLEIPSNKVSSVVNSVSKSLFNVKVDTPSKTTVQNIISEGNVISHQQVAHELLESDNWGVFSDGTSRDGKKIVDIGVHTNKQSFSLGFIPVAVENSETVSNVIQSKISDAANVVNNVVNFEDGNIENKNRLLKAFTSVMSDRSSVMKKTNVLLDEWRKQTLKQGGLHNDEIKNLEFLYCSAHVLLGFHSEMEKQVKSYEKDFGPIGRDSLGMFKNYRQNNEPAAFRAIRTASECLGPNGDEKNGARQHWLSYCEMNNKKSQIISYRSNRFNNLYDGARTVLLHRNDIIDFFSNHFSNPNLKLKSVLGDISCEKVYTNIVCLAAIGCYVTSPFWDLVNSNEHYLDLHNFFQPMYEQMKLWSENCEAVFDGEVDPIFTKYPHKLNESYNILLQELKKVKESGIQAFSLMCKSISRVMERQLADFLPEGIYSKDATEDHKKSTAHTKITNIPAENLFGDLDYSIKRKHNASVFHHSSIVMLKRNKTVNWLKRKHIFLRSQIMATGRKHAKLYKQRSKAIEKEVSRKRQNILKETKQKKVLKQQKSETELRRIENSVKSMGGIVKSLRDIEHLLHVTKNLKEKKLKLRDQLLYIKNFLWARK